MGICYARGRLPVGLVFAGLAVVELVAVDLLVPWERLGGFAWLRLVVLPASAYGVVWVALWMVAERTRPHLVTDEGLVLRWGHLPTARADGCAHPLQTQAASGHRDQPGGRRSGGRRGGDPGPAHLDASFPLVPIMCIMTIR